jgi:hypothetical protein
MKTTIFPSLNTAFCSIIGFFSFLATSCGSYQNSSYYDSDGIYGNTNIGNTEKIAQKNPSNHYKEYFNSLQNENQPTEIFTDINKYSDSNSSNDTDQRINQGYAGWGNNSGKTTVNIYTNPNPWNTSLGFGWGFPTYIWGYDYGWNYPFYGWSYSSFGWNYPYYRWSYPYSYGYYDYPYYNYPYYNYAHYHNSTYSYNNSRRGSSYSNSGSVNRNYDSGRYAPNNTTVHSEANYSNSRSTVTNTSENRTTPTFSRRNESQNQFNSSNSVYRTRTNSDTNNSPRSESYTPSRSYSPSSDSSSRSSGSLGTGGRPSGSSGRR